MASGVAHEETTTEERAARRDRQRRARHPDRVCADQTRSGCDKASAASLRGSTKEETKEETRRLEAQRREPWSLKGTEWEEGGRLNPGRAASRLGGNGRNFVRFPGRFCTVIRNQYRLRRRTVGSPTVGREAAPERATLQEVLLVVYVCGGRTSLCSPCLRNRNQRRRRSCSCDGG